MSSGHPVFSRRKKNIIYTVNRVINKIKFLSMHGLLSNFFMVLLFKNAQISQIGKKLTSLWLYAKHFVISILKLQIGTHFLS